jgi:hypothetical protein
VKEEADTEIDRHPWQIKQCRRPSAREEAADLIKIPQWLQAVAVSPGLQRQAHERIEYTNAELLIKIAPDTRADPAPDQVESALEQVKHGRQHDQRDQRGYAAAGKHPIINLQHEKRAGEHQEIAHAAEGRERPEDPAARPQERRHLRPRLIIVVSRPWLTREHPLPQGFDEVSCPADQLRRPQFGVFRPLLSDGFRPLPPDGPKSDHSRELDSVKIHRRGDYPPPSKVCHGTRP